MYCACELLKIKINPSRGKLWWLTLTCYGVPSCCTNSGTEDRVTYRNMQTVDFILRLTGDFFQAFGIYFHQIKQPFAITNFFWPLNIQGSSAKCFQWSAQVSYLLKQTNFLWSVKYFLEGFSSWKHYWLGQALSVQLTGIHNRIRIPQHELLVVDF